MRIAQTSIVPEAARMLEAWRHGAALPMGRLKTVREAPGGMSSLESECLDLLDGVAEDMLAVSRSADPQREAAPARVRAWCKLLGHLTHRAEPTLVLTRSSC